MSSRVYGSRMTTTPPGWYDDGHDATRWWDGTRWTEHVAEPGAMDGAGRRHRHPSARPAAGEVETVDRVGRARRRGARHRHPGRHARSAADRRSRRRRTARGAGTPADPDQRAAVAAVELYDEAWQDADCEAYVASTTESFRTQSGLTDCSAFETEAETFTDAVEDYEIDVTDVRRDGDAIVVTTTETYSALVGEDGAPLDEPTEDSIDWVYTVVADGDDWLIDAME